ncbi:MAG: NCS2 family permease [Candidatus Brocadiaceae bacterium]|nr:NCS2 family permease [Candidatus Brocadiaceae bacterium]
MQRAKVVGASPASEKLKTHRISGGSCLKKLFPLKESNTTVLTEVIAGVTTFLSMSYIIFVQPAVLSTCGMDFGSVLTATCIASAVGTLLMGLLARYPIAQAPAMGHNFYFAFIVCGPVAMGGMGYPWQVALGATVISGSLFVILSAVGLKFRELIIGIIPDSLKNAIAVGIGLLIALIGFQYGGVIVDSPGTLVTLGNPKYPEVWLTLFGTVLIGVLVVLRIKGAILIGIFATAMAGIPLGITKYHGIVSMPASLAPTFAKVDVVGLFKHKEFFTVIFVLFFLDLFDSIGTLVGIGEQGGFMKDGKLPRVQWAFFSDAVATVVGAVMGTSTVSSYIESTAGIQAGGRTGLANMVTAFLLLLSLFFLPIVETVGGGYPIQGDRYLYPIIAPALIIVGSMMLGGTARIRWDDPTEAIPAFLTISIIPFSVSITEGLAFGFISYSILKAVSGQGLKVHWLFHLVSAAFVARYVLLRG